MKYDSLCKDALHYFKLCEATVRSEMAKRIMHSILPGVASPEEVSGTKGIVDYKSLAAAVEGRKDIIRLAGKAIKSELEHYSNVDWSKNKLIEFMNLLNSLESNKDWLTIATIGVELFNEPEHWGDMFGGKRWGDISKSVRDIAILDQKLDLVRKDKANPEFVDKEIELMNDLVIQLNIFDGLAHNSASIMNNLISLEAEELAAGNPESPYQFANEGPKVIRLMDSKELRNPIDVYREVEETLKETGDINRYKDWVTKIKGHPDYRNPKYDEMQLEMTKIRIRKQLVYVKQEFKKTIAAILANYEIFKELGKSLDANGFPNNRQEYIKTYSSTNTLVDKIRHLGSQACLTIKPYTYGLALESIWPQMKKFYEEIIELNANAYAASEGLENAMTRKVDYVIDKVGNTYDAYSELYYFIESI